MNSRLMVLIALVAALGAACTQNDKPAAEAPAAEKAQAEKANPSAKAEPKPAEAGNDGAGADEAAPAGDRPAADAPAAALADPAKAVEQAPETFVVELSTTKGPIRLDVDRKWAPKGADRFYNLVQSGYYTDVAFFRVIPGFMAQVGLHGDPAINRTWRSANIEDDPVTQSNTRGMVSFATAGPNTRTTQFFINFADNTRLDSMGFSPFARVQPESMAIVDKLHGGYGEGAPRGRGPSQARIHAEGNTYLKAEFPELDYIQKAAVVKK